MLWKWCAGSLLKYFTRKVKDATTSVSIEDITLTDLTLWDGVTVAKKMKSFKILKSVFIRKYKE
jgi:hypothetical protein